MSDKLVKAITKGVRVYAAVTTDLVNEAIRRHDCYPVAAAALGRTMTGALLLAANLKNKEALTVNIRGNGPLKNITADAVPEGFVRGYVADPHVELPLNDKGKLDVGGGVGQGLVTVTRFTGLREPMRGSSEIVTGEIAEDLTNYLYVSEQTPSSIGLGVLVDTDFSAKAAGGFMIQPMPDADEEIISKLEANLQKLRPVTTMIDEGKDAKEIILEIMSGFDMEFLTTTDLAFKCQCSKERLEDVLLNLNHDDMESLIADGQAEVCCHFCGEKYHFTKEELQHLLKLADAVK
ncbi:Hsp33 family molecular chaperone HslO [Anaerovibrio sp.]|uniref:Hsp33 family molecular chaperone HslO n=1 Tax=Anaerovibrio sp. TaxID=1872532 RepID=UPI00261ADDFC|nr:Hsp33 family molecular chaperone HslO [Anaerovibrio sp.]MDD6596782.1 Hsp33 family molecular chaperone HslO [Anaerovibrio sp.]MDD7677683.1 Hsp33 family molecular chaperone HslO [Anaerovibrio sp.]MDY2602813.1 Hsp33 family molecular chaperone HslO [Anaerovibrio sp.]MDY4883563.1 Hsp33 family molecular chaperone HslO [Anaerovibrio sp.]